MLRPRLVTGETNRYTSRQYPAENIQSAVLAAGACLAHGAEGFGR